jgi:hypothetical protein
MEKSQLAAGSFFVPGDFKEKRERVRNTQPPLFTMRVALYVVKATCVNRTGGFLLREIIDKATVMWYDMFKNSTVVRKIKKESE